MTKALLAILLATAFAGIGIRLGSAPTSIARSQNAIPGAAPTPTPGSFTHPLVFPPVDTNGNVSISIDEGCIQILDGPCTNMWTYGGTYPGLTVRRPTGQPTNVTFMGNRNRCLSRQEDRGRTDMMGWKRVGISAERHSFTMITAWMLRVETSGWVLLDCTL